MTVKALIFDMDGTLLDSMDAWMNVSREYLESQGFIDIPETHGEEIAPLSMNQYAEFLKREFKINQDPETIIEDINMLIERKYTCDIQLKPTVRSFLQKNKALRMCIATLTEKNLAEKALRRLEIDQYFEFILSPREVGISKDNPNFFLKVVEILGIEKNEVCVIEDSLYAIKSAKAAGLKTIAVSEKTNQKDKAEIQALSDLFVQQLIEFEV